MKTFGVNADNDLYLGTDGNLVILEGLAALTQICEQAVKTQLGEMVLATDGGMPNFQVIWNGSPNIPQFKAALYKILMSVEGVTGIAEMNVTAVENVLSYEATILSIFGKGAVNGNL